MSWAGGRLGPSRWLWTSLACLAGAAAPRPAPAFPDPTLLPEHDTLQLVAGGAVAFFTDQSAAGDTISVTEGSFENTRVIASAQELRLLDTARWPAGRSVSLDGACNIR